MKMPKNEEIAALKIIIKSTEEFIQEVKKEFADEKAQKALWHIEKHLSSVTNEHFHRTSLS